MYAERSKRINYVQKLWWTKAKQGSLVREAFVQQSWAKKTGMTIMYRDWYRVSNHVLRK